METALELVGTNEKQNGGPGYRQMKSNIIVNSENIVKIKKLSESCVYC